MLKNKISKALILPVMAVLGLGVGFATMAGAQTAATSDSTASPASIVSATATTATAQAIDPTDPTDPADATDAADTADVRPEFDSSKGGHVGQNGVKEELLTGDLAAKATSAALAAVPGSTIERVETDAEGAAYEAHMTKADGSHVTVKFDSNMNVTATENGHGHR